jgi:hypothetical protein
MNIIDETYNGDKYPIIEREYNAYYFPDNYDPENMDAYIESQIEAAETHQQIKIYHRDDVKLR